MISDVFLDVGLGRAKVSDDGAYSRSVDLHEHHVITLTSPLDIENVREHAHEMLDVMLDDLKEKHMAKRRAAKLEGTR